MNTTAASTALDRERTRLESLRDDLRAATEADPLSGDTSISAQHPGDLGTEMFERSKDLSLLDQVESQLADVARAAQHVDAGTFGVCETCGQPIPEARLEAIPWTRYCLEDQQELERIRRATT